MPRSYAKVRGDQFLADGCVVIYDFVWVKSVPPIIANGYRELARAGWPGQRSASAARGDGRHHSLGWSGVREAHRARARPVLFKVLDEARPYRFGYDDQPLRQVIDNNPIHFGEAKDIRFPHHIVFINRTAAGHYGNLSRLRAAAPWRRMVEARVA